MEVTLKEVNGSHTIDMPLGTTILGRGPLLKCTDKRVSRNHAELEIVQTDDKKIHVYLSALQKGLPCYYGKQGSTDSTETTGPNVKQELFHGDVLYLLPKAIAYEISINQTPDTLSENDKENTEVNEPQAGTSMLQSKKRVLPDWLLAAAGDTGTSSPSTSTAKVTKRRDDMSDDDSKPSTSKKPKKTPQKTAKKVKAHRLSQEDFEAPQKASKEESDEEGPVTSQKNIQKAKARKHDLSQSQGDSVSLASQNERSDSEDEKKDLDDEEKEEKKAARPACMYAEKCYRKNPSHKEQFSHPGDDDYKVIGETNDEDLPECPYGILCYRKNPQHKKEYKHTKKPTRKAANRANKKRKKMLEDDENDSYESSFIDDSDEYNPDSTDEEDNEDIGELVSDAKNIIRSKK